MFKYARDLEKALSQVVNAGGVDFSDRRRAEYSADGSNYRRVPEGVVFPANASELITAVSLCRSMGVPITMRGAGTSVAGNAIGKGVVIDCSRHMKRIIKIDPNARTARVEPGVVLDDLQKAAGKYGLQFGPDPSTHSRCTIGGMIGNNSCGPRSLAYGRTADNVIELEILRYDGSRMTIGHTLEAEIYETLQDLRIRYDKQIRERSGRFRRQISGYSLEHLLPENDFNVARALVGTEGTCAIVLEATVQLVPVPAARGLVVLGFKDLPLAADAVPALLSHSPSAIEGMDSQIVEATGAVLPEGNAWLLIEFTADSQDELQEKLTQLESQLVAETSAIGSRLAVDPADQTELWRLREDGAGIATRLPDGNEAWPGWEDAAVPPENLGAYIRGFQRLLKKHGRHGAMYGHFGEGCVHTRIDFDFTKQQGIEEFRAFVTDACKLAGKHKGSFSGEHGDGMARSEFLPLMYGDDLVNAFREFKKVWDPSGRLNPGIVVDPVRMDEFLRVDPKRKTIPVETAYWYQDDDLDFAKAVRRCVGIGKCRSDEGGVMCPSYRATHDERDSTRGRARVLHEMLIGDVVKKGWRSKDVLEALDLCLSCKGCKTDCPVNVDMATYKAEFLNKHYAGRIRPRTHYSLGWLPVLAKKASRFPRLFNFFAPLGKPIAGIAHDRQLPKLARTTFREWFATKAPAPPAGDRKVLLWVDTFTNYFAPEIGQAAVKVFHAAGFQVILPPEDEVCCGLTYISTGQLDRARKALVKSLDVVDPIMRSGTPMVVLEPSCAAAFRSDAVDLLADDPRAKRTAESVLTFAEFLDVHAPDFELPQIGGKSLAQTHCHQYAVMGFGADERVMKRLGLDNTTLDKGCCGLAGNFGFEKAHYNVSVAVGEHGPVPEIRSADATTIVLSDGFSCRTQFSQLANRSSLHIAELVAQNLP